MKILLVDDNIYILEGLKTGIDYKKLGIEKVYEARSMKNAMDILNKNEIDIVLTDIEMPNGTGLELLEWINQYKPHVVTLFCTSYADFDYAKKAVELHSFDYYLKPIQYEELYKILQRAVEKVRKQKQQLEKSKMGEYWIGNIKENKNQFWYEALIRIFAYAEEELEELAESRHLIYSNTDFFTIAILRFADKNKGINSLNYSMQQFVLDNMVEEFFGKSNLQMEGLIKSDKEYWILILSREENCGVEYVEYILKKFMTVTMHYLKCKLFVGYFEKHMFMEIRSRFLELEQFCMCISHEEGGLYSYEQLKNQFSVLEEGGDNVVQQVKEYIDAHYKEDINRDNMGNITFYNPAYLAKIFKREMGQSIGNYLMERRVERAKELLITTNMSIADIAVEIGYDNFSYFSRMFKKKTGYAPKEYKKEMSFCANTRCEK